MAYEQFSDKGRRKKILAVDDCGLQLRNVKNWLQDRYDVKLANSAKMALSSIKEEVPDLIILDYEMPECNGKEFLEKLRNDSQYNDIDVIFLTSVDNKKQIAEVLALRPSGYLLKPVAYEKLISEINRIL